MLLIALCIGTTLYLTHVVEVVEDGETVLGSPAVGLGAPGAGEGPGVAALADALAPPVLPAQGALVAADPAAGPEVGGAVGGDLLHEVIPLGGVIQGDHPHAATGAVAAGRSPRQVVDSLPEVKPLSPTPHSGSIRSSPAL